MMYGYANIDATGVDITSGSAQTAPKGIFKAAKFAHEQKIPVELHNMVASSIGIGPLTLEAISEDSGDIKGIAPALAATVTITDEDKVTITT